MPLANQVIPPSNFRPAESKPRAARFTGRVSRTKQKKAAIFSECFLAGQAADVREEAGAARILIPHLHTVNTLNVREHWSMRRYRNNMQGSVIAAALCFVPDALRCPPLLITLTRIGPRAMDDDGVSASFKHVRDVIAEWLGIDDGDKRVKYQTAQRKGKYGIEIEIKAAIAGRTQPGAEAGKE